MYDSRQIDGRSHDTCLLYTSDAADERSSVDLGGRRIINKKTHVEHPSTPDCNHYEKRSRLVCDTW